MVKVYIRSLTYIGYVRLESESLHIPRFQPSLGSSRHHRICLRVEGWRPNGAYGKFPKILELLIDSVGKYARNRGSHFDHNDSGFAVHNVQLSPNDFSDFALREMSPKIIFKQRLVRLKVAAELRKAPRRI